MPRRPRIEIPGFYHIINRGVEQRVVFKEPADYEYFEWFAPDVGLVQRDVSSFAGQTRYVLISLGPVVSVDEDAPEFPAEFELFQNHPNPFNPLTSIDYHLAEKAEVSLIIYDIRGRKVVELINEQQSAGRHQMLWNSLNSLGNPVSSGVYFSRIQIVNPGTVHVSTALLCSYSDNVQANVYVYALT